MDNIVDNFLKWMDKMKYSDLTTKQYITRLGAFNGRLRQNYQLGIVDDVEEISVMMINKYADYLLGFQQPITVNVSLATIKLYLKWCKGMGLCTFDQRGIFKMRFDRKKMVWTDKDTMQYTIDNINGDANIDKSTKRRNTLLVRLMFQSLLRVSETISLKVSDVMNYNGSLQIVGKKNKVRTIAISDLTLFELKVYIKNRPIQSDYVFVSHANNIGCNEDKTQRLSRNAVANIIKKYRPVDSIVTPHSFRHGGATLLAMNNTPVHVIADILGHDNINTTHCYLHVANLEKRKYQEVLFSV